MSLILMMVIINTLETPTYNLNFIVHCYIFNLSTACNTKTLRDSNYNVIGLCSSRYSNKNECDFNMADNKLIFTVHTWTYAAVRIHIQYALRSKV